MRETGGTQPLEDGAALLRVHALPAACGAGAALACFCTGRDEVDAKGLVFEGCILDIQVP